MPPLTILLIVVLSIGAVQGIVYGALFLRGERSNATASRLLAALLFFFAYQLVIEILRLFGLGYYDVWYHLTQEFNWIYGPLIYLFVKAWLEPDFRLSRQDWIHFLPVGLELLCNNFVRSQNFYWDGTRDSLSWLGYWGYVVWMNYPFKYIVASLLLVFYTRRAALLVRAFPATKKVAWLARVLRAFSWYFAIIIGIVLIDFALFFDASFRTFYYFFTRFYYYPLFIGIAALTYWLGMESYLKKAHQPQPDKTASSPEQLAGLETLASRIRQLMTEAKVYQDPNLSLHSLAAQLNVKPYLISQCLKEIMKTRFNDYVNRFRIEALKRRLRDPGKAHYTLLSLAFESGFNSKASFQRAVKKFEGISPSALREKLA
ncbi:helix-turn-helix transcriptional regulator [Neolewinella persica]|uniref:helix-turn-helix transcriptional regulator n=1 Tax=Neolewinella persica TaxID=70998 RepID=UPI00037C427D|nr:helix-turn-helix transcriptional regulator [Neolewinella persica]